MKHPDSQDWSAYLDGEVSPSEARELEEHLGGCESCGVLLSQFQEIRRRARDLPDRFPPRDLWPQIARAIREEEEGAAEVIPLHPSGPARSLDRPRPFRLSISQAVAAGLILALVSGAVGARLGRVPGQSGPGTQAEVREVTWVQQVSQASPRLEGSAMEVARLEEALATWRQALDSVTVQILERNLRVIDRAIQESVEALAADPGNEFLQTHLERAILAKGEYLRDATLLVAPVT